MSEISSVARFYRMKAPCSACQRPHSWLKPTCLNCGERYPVARPTIYWAGILVATLGVVCVPIALLGLWGIL